MERMLCTWLRTDVVPKISERYHIHLPPIVRIRATKCEHTRVEKRAAEQRCKHRNLKQMSVGCRLVLIELSLPSSTADVRMDR